MSVFKNNWDYCREQSKTDNSFHEFERNISSLISKIENGLKTQTFINNHNGIENQDDELKNLVENNKELRYQKDKKLKETSTRVAQYENLKKDQKLLKQEIKNTHEAFLMAKKYYKKYLKMYYTIQSKDGENQTILVQFFTEAKKDSDNFSATLLRNTNTGHCQFISTAPNLESMEEIHKKLQKSNDIPGALCYIRQAFKESNSKKK